LPRPALAWLLAVAGAAGCADAPVVEAPLPVTVSIEVSAAAGVNPDAEGRASPVAVRVYQLADSGAFSRAEFFPLWDQEPAVLAASSVARHDFGLVPGGSSAVRFELDPRVRTIGVAAAFRDFRKAVWRTSVAIPEKPEPGSTLRLKVTVESLAVTAAWQ
jgi:type VI secretion system protein VasD